MADEIQSQGVPVDLGAPAEPGNGQSPAAADDWFEHVPQEYRDEKLWEPMKGKPLAEVLKSYAEAQKLVGRGVRLPDEKAPPEEWDKFYERLGRPAKPEDYKIGRPEMVPEELYDSDFEAAFRRIAHETGLSQKQVERLFGWYNEAMLEKVGEYRRAQREQLNSLMQEWGGAAKRNIALAKRAVEHLGGDELRQFFNETGLGDSPVMVKLFARLGDWLLEAGMIDETPEVSGEDAQREAHRIVFDRSHPDHAAYINPADPRHREVVDRVEKMFQQAYSRPRA